MNNTLLRISFLIVAAAVLVRVLVGTQRTGAAPPEKLEIVVWGFSSNGCDGNNDPGIGRAAPPPSPCDLTVSRIWEAESEDDLCSPSEPDALFEEPLLASRQELLNFQYRYTGDDAEADGSDSNCDDNDGSVSQTAAVPTVAALWDVPDPPKPVAPARYVNDQSAPAGDDRDPQLPTAYSYAGDATPPAPPAAEPQAPVPNAPADSAPDDDDGRSFFNWQRPPEPCVRVEAVEFSRPAQIILIGYGFESRRAWGNYAPLCDDETDPPEESWLVLIGGPAAIAALDRSASKGIASAADERHRWSIWFCGPSEGFWQDLLRDPVTDEWFRSLTLGPERVSILSVVSVIALAEYQRHLMIAVDDGTLRLCSEPWCDEICRLKQSADGVWRVVGSDALSRAAGSHAPKTRRRSRNISSVCKWDVAGTDLIQISDPLSHDESNCHHDASPEFDPWQSRAFVRLDIRPYPIFQNFRL